MIDKICTPIKGGWYSVLRWGNHASSGFPGMALLTDTVSNAKSATLMKKHHLIPALVSVASRNQVQYQFSAATDPTVAWAYINQAAVNIALSTMRAGGTTVAVTQEMYNFLKPHQPPSFQVIWVIDQTAALNFALVTYRGMDDSDGGYPCQDNGDGTVTLYNVHNLDGEYYRAVEIDVPAPKVDQQKVSLNW